MVESGYSELQNSGNYAPDTRIVDLEERQRLLRDRVLLIGDNLIDFRESVGKDLIKIKSDVEKVKESVERMQEVLERISEELDTKARKEDLNILKKQAKMFEPLKLATLEEVKDMIEELKK